MQVTKDRLHGKLPQSIPTSGIAVSAGTVRPARPEDVDYLAPRLRGGDLREIAALTNKPPKEILAGSVALSAEPLAIERSGNVCALMGVAPHPRYAGVGIIWLLASEDLREIWKSFAVYSPAWLEYLSRDFAVVCNVVAKWQTAHIRWLRWLGFEFDPAPGIGNGEFLYFKKRRNDD